MYKPSPSPLHRRSPMGAGEGRSPSAFTGTLTLMGTYGEKQLACVKMAVLATGHWVFPVDIQHQIRGQSREIISQLDPGAGEGFSIPAVNRRLGFEQVTSSWFTFVCRDGKNGNYPKFCSVNAHYFWRQGRKSLSWSSLSPVPDSIAPDWHHVWRLSL